MKAVLITEMPANCFECYFRGGEDQYSVCCTPDLAGKEVGEYDERRPDFCPLMYMPEYYPRLPHDASYRAGWNDAIREIGGSGEDG